MQNAGPNTHDPAYAVVVARPSFNCVPVCKRDLDSWLDNIDDGELGDPDEVEPADLIFL
jgi:hypothetical protein